MSPALAKHFHEIVANGIDLIERLEQGAKPPLKSERERLKVLLLASELKNDPDFAGDPNVSDIRNTMGRGDGRFLGARYALTCWLDEIFLADADAWWALDWNENQLEVAIFGGSSNRYWKFPEQARLAEQRPGIDPLEIYYWCVMLGFRGEWAEKPDDLRNWTVGIRNRIRQSHRVELKLPEDLGMDTHVPQLTAGDRLTGIFKLAAALTLIAVVVLIPLLLNNYK